MQRPGGGPEQRARQRARLLIPGEEISGRRVPAGSFQPAMRLVYRADSNSMEEMRPRQ